MFVNAPSEDVTVPLNAAAAAAPAAQAPFDASQQMGSHDDYRAGAMPVAALPPQHLGAEGAPMPTWAKVAGASLLAWAAWRYFQ